jgi:hypothetical protein
MQGSVMMKPEEVGTYRIDIVDGKFTIYWFIHPSDRKLHEWWATLIDFLNGVQERELRQHPTRGNLIEVATLRGALRDQFIRLLGSAPESDKKDHRSLRRAIRVLPDTSDNIQVLYFSKAVAA